MARKRWGSRRPPWPDAGEYVLMLVPAGSDAGGVSLPLWTHSEMLTPPSLLGQE